MIVKQSGGMTEFIPSPSQAGRRHLQYVLTLANLDSRIRRIEAAGLPLIR